MKITPVNSIKNLAYTIQNNLKWDTHIEKTSNSIRSLAGRIRSFKYLPTKHKLTLYHSWINGILCSNGLAYLQLVNKRQLKQLQTTCNQGIRAIANLPRQGQQPLTETRRKLGLCSVKGLTMRLIWKAAWVGRDFIRQSIRNTGPDTRSNRLGMIRNPCIRGLRDKMVSTQVIRSWNSLLAGIKSCDSKDTAKKLIRLATSNM